MNYENFHNINHLIPAESGTYTWKSKQMGYIKVKYDHGDWFLINGDKLPDRVVQEWR